MRVISTTLIALAVGVLSVTGAASGANSVPTQDREYMLATAEGNYFEIDIARSVARHAATSTARALADRLERDHSAELAELKTLAASLHVNLPKHPSIKQRHEISRVLSHHGTALDRAYARLEVSDHQQDIAETTKEIADGQLDPVKAFASKYLPMYHEHLALSRKAAKVLHAR